MALTSYVRSNLVSEWKLLSLSHLTHYTPGVLYLCIENRKKTPDVKQQNTALNLVMFRLLSRFIWKINRIKCHSRCPYYCNQTLHSVKEGKFHLSHMHGRLSPSAQHRVVYRKMCRRFPVVLQEIQY